MLQPFNSVRVITPIIGGLRAPFRHLASMRLASENSENRTQKIEFTNMDQTLDKKNHLFFQISFDALYRHWIAYQ
jgi:hypothetical protein